MVIYCYLVLKLDNNKGVGMMKVYRESLTQSRQLLLEEIENVSQEQFNMKMNEKSWSIAQICQHILLSERLFHEAIKVALKREDTVAEPVSFAALYGDNKYEAPSYVVPEDKMYDKKTVIHELQQCRFQVFTTLDSITDVPLYHKKVYPHYLFGPLSVGQWLELMSAHELRHIRQISKLIL